MANTANRQTSSRRSQSVKKPQHKSSHSSALSQYLAVGNFDVPFLLLVIIILTTGLVMLFSASYTYAYYNNHGDSAYFFKRQLAFAVAGVIAMLVISKIKYEYFKILAYFSIPFSIVLLIVVLIMPAKFGDFHRWIYIGSFSFQPSEIAKLAIIMYCAYGLEKDHKIIIGKTTGKTKVGKLITELSGGKIELYDSFISMCWYGGIIILIAILVYAENHLSGALLICGIGVTMLFLGEVKKHWFYLIVVIGVLMAVFFVMNPSLLEKYAGARITAWLDKDYQPLGARWQTNNSLYAIGSGGLFGAGLGNSKQKHLYVSEPQNDFIFSIVCEELGLVGASIILIIFALLVWRGIVIGIHAKDRFCALLAMGIVFQVGMQTILNILVVTDTLPNTGISLPFFSYGGTSLMMLLGEMGMVLSVSRYSRLTKN